MLRARGLACGAALVLCTCARSQVVTFQDVGPAMGIEPYAMAFGMGAGVAAEDYDFDGDIDLFVPTKHGTPDQLYRNRGDGTFEEIAADVGLASYDNSRIAIWLDYDADGLMDLLVSRDVFLIASPGDDTDPTDPDDPPHPEAFRTLLLMRQQVDGTFEDVTVAANLHHDLLTLASTSHTGGLTAGDLNGDGWLDIVATVWRGYASIFMNDGDGTFTRAPATNNVGAYYAGYWTPIIHDFSGDGLMDLFLAVDFEPNRLWVNQGDGTYLDMAGSSACDNAWNDMGVAPGDYDNDGDIDLYITNIDRFEGVQRHNVLLRNDTMNGAIQFTEVSEQAGVSHGYWGWGCTFFDADLDTLPDLAATNGFGEVPWTDDPSKFFHNLGGASPVFEDVSDAVGFNDTFIGAALLAVDLDRDGDLDMVQATGAGGPLRILMSEPGPDAAGRGWLLVRPRQDGPNHHAIGALVRTTAGEVTMTRLVTCGTSFMGQEPAEAFFGLGAAESATVRVEWPGGGATVYSGVARDRVLIVQRGACPGDASADGLVTFADLDIVLGEFNTSSDGPADVTGDGEVGFADLNGVLSNWGLSCEHLP